MKTIDCSSWEEFEKQVLAISKEYEDKKKKEKQIYISKLLFRGQESADWKLETTLERYGQPVIKMVDYYSVLEMIIPADNSSIEKAWGLPEYNCVEERSQKPPPGYEFMVYLRHHGFPSPLLDWTRSPYVAAFFALRNKRLLQTEKVAIYSYIEWCGKGKSIRGDQAFLVGLGPYITTHRRHYTQQCEYTICKKPIENDYVFCPHEEAFSRNAEDQDQLTKFILPKSERTKVLEKLNLMNVNAYSLFGNEEGLMETLAYQEIEKKFPNTLP